MKKGTHCWLVAFLLMALLSSVVSGQQFRTAVYYTTGKGTAPYTVVAAELTNSRNIDLVIADYVSGEISVLLGNGDGTFQAPMKVLVSAPFALAAGDFNEDGLMDLAVVQSAGTSVGYLQLLFGEGNGKFQVGPKYQLGVEPISVALADLNGDGHLDVAVANKGGTAMTFFGDGHGNLRQRTGYKVAGGPFGIAAADLNGDHYPDLAVTQVRNGTVAVLLNDGTGHFSKPVSYNAGGGEVVDVKVADLRNDGKQDLVVANGSLSAIGVLLGKGDGTFAPVKLYPTHSDVEAVVVADFNLDGHLDAAVAAQIDNSALLYGKGDGTFGPPVPIKDEIGTDGGYSLAVGDFNNDHAPDLAIPIELKGKVAMLLNTQ
jgi:FG-GAP-like repeat